MRKINQEGLDLIKKFEGCKLMPYKDSAGVWTVGYGHTGPSVVPDVTITQNVADFLLASDCANAEAAVTRLVTQNISDNAFSALVSFVFNLGQGTLKRSKLLQKLNAGDIQGASLEFLDANRINGKVSEGLTNRRIAERELFLK